MEVARNLSTLRVFFPLGKSVVYALSEFDPERLKTLAPDSRIGGKRLVDDVDDVGGRLPAAVKIEAMEP